MNKVYSVFYTTTEGNDKGSFQRKDFSTLKLAKRQCRQLLKDYPFCLIEIYERYKDAGNNECEKLVEMVSPLTNGGWQSERISVEK